MLPSEDAQFTSYRGAAVPVPPFRRGAAALRVAPPPDRDHAPAHASGRATDGAVIEQAKGALMLRYGVGSYESLAALARWAREAEVSLVQIARALVAGICQGRVSPADRPLVRWLEQCLRDGIPDPVGTERRKPAIDQVQARRPGIQQAPDVAAVKRWRYASAVHAARGLVT